MSEIVIKLRELLSEIIRLCDVISDNKHMPRTRPSNNRKTWQV